MHLKALIIISFIPWLWRSVSAQPAISPRTQKLLKWYNNWQKNGSNRFAIEPEHKAQYLLELRRGEWVVHGFVETNHDTCTKIFQQYGIEIKSKLGTLHTASIPLRQLANVCREPLFKYIEISEALYPIMWETLQETGTIMLHNGDTELGMVTGKNVVVGVIDIGFDFTHPNFFDRNGNKSRILAVWNQEDTTGPVNPQFGYGSLYEGETAILQKGYDDYGVKLFHGSHTAGIAAGSGFGTNGRHAGIAPDAQLVLVSSSLRSDQVVDAAKFIFDYAAKRNLPAVINMSFGAWWGAMDGTKAMDRSLSALTGRGKIIVAAMGNEGLFKQHLRYEFKTPTDTLRTLVKLANSGGPNRKPAIAECWGEINGQYTLAVGTINRSGKIIRQSPWIALTGEATDDSLDLVGIQVGITSYAKYPSNQRPYAEIRLYTSTDTLEPVLMLTSNTAGKQIRVYCPFTNLLDKFNADDQFSLHGFSKGDSLSSGRSPAVSAAKVVAVGAYVDKNVINSADGGKIDIPTSANPFTIGQYAPFSSRGPSLDNRLKPDVTAPGVVLVSSYNSFIQISDEERAGLPRAAEAIFDFRGRTYHWVFASGTSMAAPVVTGTVALMLSLNPNLDYFDVVQIIRNSAKTDAFTGTNLPNNSWGYGKVNTLLAVTQASQFDRLAKPLVFPNPFNDKLRISGLNTFSPNAIIELVDVQGRIIIHTTLEANNNLIWDTAQLKPGLYVMHISDYKQRHTVKLIKF